MARAEHSEVAMVESSKLRLIQAFNDGKDGRVDKANVGIRILVAQFSSTPVIGNGQIIDREVALDYFVQEGDENSRVHPFPQPVIELGENRGWNDESLTCIKQSTATSVIRIAIVDRCEKWASVED